MFDAAISIAVLHHLSTEQRRLQALREAGRVLRPGGELLVYCWSYEQDAEISRSRHRFVAQDVLVPFHHRNPGVKKEPAEKQPKQKKLTKKQRAAEAKKQGGYAQEEAPAANGAEHTAVVDSQTEEPAETVKPADEPATADGRDATASGAAAVDAPAPEWQEKPEAHQRYCHVYREGELVGLFAQLPEFEMVESYFDTGNWCAIARKKGACCR